MFSDLSLGKYMYIILTNHEKVYTIGEMGHRVLALIPNNIFTLKAV